VWGFQWFDFDFVVKAEINVILLVRRPPRRRLPRPKATLRSYLLSSERSGMSLIIVIVVVDDDWCVMLLSVS
jgi:hypothetical protein